MSNELKILKPGASGTVFIYSLNDPETDEIRYIGKTIDINSRYREHIRKVNYTDTYKNNWIKSLMNEGKLPVIKVVEEVSEGDWEAVERRWIKTLRDSGVRLTNIAEGGEGGNHGPETNKKISKALKGRVFSADTIEKMRQSRLGKTASKETKEKMSLSRRGEGNGMYGKKHSKETKKKIKENHTDMSGKNNPMYGKRHKKESIDSMKEKLSVLNSGEGNPFYGKKHSEEFKKSKRKKVMQLTMNGDLVKIWDSITEAAESLNIKQGGISNVCDKETKSYKNFKWKKIKTNELSCKQK